jgi:hypothetical protein
MSQQPPNRDLDIIEIVKPMVKAKDALTEIKAFEELKSKLLSESDFQSISGKNFIKKSGWRKLALVFNISDQIVVSSKKERPDGSFVWFFRVKAIAPNGRFTEAVGSCDSKERRFAHAEHDVYATAHTRSKSRAISDLIGAGEISAEEMEASASGGNLTSDIDAPDLETEAEVQKARSLLHTANSIFSEGYDQKSVPAMSTESRFEPDGSSMSRFELKLQGRDYFISEKEAPFSRFFIGKICRSISEQNPDSHFELEKSDDGLVRAIVWYNLPEAQKREVENTLAWSLKKISENKVAPS